LPRPAFVFSSLLAAFRRRSDRDRDRDLGAYQPRQPRRQHYADAAARHLDPAKGGRPFGGSGGIAAVVAGAKNPHSFHAATCLAAARPASASASFSRSSGLIRKPFIPASKQA